MKAKLTLCTALFVFSFSRAWATNYTITFASNFYSPDSLWIQVGDVVTWSGSFSSHPLESTSVPNGAATFSSSTGTSYSYTVTVAGTYNYHCSFHNFKGVLIVSSPNSITEPALTTEINIYPNPATNQLFVETKGTLVEEMNIYNAAGNLVQSTKPQTLNFKLETANYPAGVYIAEIKTKEASVKRRWVKM